MGFANKIASRIIVRLPGNFSSNSVVEPASVKTESSQWSYVHGASSRPLVHKTVLQVLERAVERVPNRDSFVFPHRGYRKTYLELWDESRRLAHGLLYLGLKPGDRVAIWSPNCYEWILTQYATARAGLILVCVNPCYKLTEMQHVLKKVGARALISPFQHGPANYYGYVVVTRPKDSRMINSLAPEVQNHPEGIGHLHLNELFSLKHLICFDWKSQTGSMRGAWNFWELAEAGGPKQAKDLNNIERQLSADQNLTIMFTSGKTGRPKASTLTHHNVVNNAMSVGHRLGLQEQRAVICSPLPLHGPMGSILGSLNSVIHYSTCVIPCSRFSSTQVLKAIQDCKCSVLTGVPTTFIDIMNNPTLKNTNINSLEKGFISGARCHPRLCKEIVGTLKLRSLHKAYGTTEVSPAAFMTTAEDDYETVGQVLDHIEAIVVDSHGQKVAREVVGELCIRGYSVMNGYWDENKTEKNRGVDANKWYRTGDLVSMDKQGRLKVAGRVKNVINRAGEAIYAKELETFLLENPAIANVVGVYDGRNGEEVCAWIQLEHGHEQTTAEKIIDFCNGKLADFKIPRYIIFKKENEMPIGQDGSLDNAKLRLESEKLLGIERPN